MLALRALKANDNKIVRGDSSGKTAETIYLIWFDQWLLLNEDQKRQ